MSFWVKICGITNLEDARAVVDAGADAIGLNFVPQSKRFVSPVMARHIVEELEDAVEWVGVVANEEPEHLEELRSSIGLDFLQLHGDEPPKALEPLLPRAFKAVAIASSADVKSARAFGGDRLLVDAKVTGELGGTGQTFDWSLVRGLVEARRVILAGGLTAENVARAVAEVKPWGVDVASGVESSPGRKDPELVRRFVERARAAAGAS